MLRTAIFSLLALIGSVVLTLLEQLAAVAALHLAFAVGLVPLIFAAISHFVPVLTRTGEIPRRIACLPPLAQWVGLLLVLVLQAGWSRSLLYPLVAVDLTACLILLLWVRQRSVACLGKPHPGWRWYALALSCFLVALLAVLLWTAFPAFYPALRRLHVHLNTLGLVGFAALGTVPVLLPTALGKADPAAAAWLQNRYRLMSISVLLLAMGATFLPPLGVVGALLLLGLLASLLVQWGRSFGLKAILKDGVSCSLLFALFGLAGVVLHGILHGLALIQAYPAILVWIAAFLLPLVTGALSQLLPVWRWPGPSQAGRLQMRAVLAQGGNGRAGLFLAAGLAFAIDQGDWACYFLGAAVLMFIVSLLRAVRVLRSTG